MSRAQVSSKSKGGRLILWAVDPLGGDAVVQRSTARALARIARADEASVQPVYVLARPRLDTLDASQEELRAEIAKEVRDRAMKAFQKQMGNTRLAGLLPLAIIDANGNSTGKTAQALTDYATEVKADLVVSSTRARKGPKRWVLGSFAETLSMICRTPLILINPTGREASTQRLSHMILFPTDLSELSHRAFGEMLKFAKTQGASVHLYHRLGFDLATAWDLSFSAKQMYGEREKIERERAERKAQAWAKEGRSRGVKVVVEVDRRTGGSIPAAILRRRKIKPDVIAMAGQSTAFEVAMLGSIARQVIRESKVPVWVLHTDFTALGPEFVREGSFE